MRNYSIAGKRGQWPAPEDTSLSYLLSYLLGLGIGLAVGLAIWIVPSYDAIAMG